LPALDNAVYEQQAAENGDELGSKVFGYSLAFRVGGDGPEVAIPEE